MTFANLSMNDTINEWRTRLNEHSLFLNGQILTGNLSTLRSNSSFITLAGNTALGSTLYLNVAPSVDGTDNSTRNIASAYMVNTALSLFSTGFNNQFANLEAQLTSDTANLANSITANTTNAINKVTSDSANSTNTVLNLVNTVNVSIAVAYGQGNAAFNQANAAYNAANVAYGASNTVNVSTASAYGQANLALSTAQSAYGFANTLNVTTTSAQYVANTPNILVTTSAIWASGAEVPLTAAANVFTLNMAVAFNANAIVSANSTLGAPANVKVGQTGRIRFIQPTPGGKTMGYNAVWKFASNVTPSLSTSNGTSDVLYYDVISPTFILASLNKGFS